MIGRQMSTVHIGFYLLPKLSMIAFSSLIEPLRMANSLTGVEHYSWSLVSSDGESVKCSNGICITPDYSVDNCECFDAVFICSGIDIHHFIDEFAIRWLRRLDKSHTILGAVNTGSFILAKAELLNNRRSTTHWELLPSIRQQFPSLEISSELFEIDEDRYTCAGGIAPLDMILCEIRDRLGADIASRISEHYMCERVRDKNDRQLIRIAQRIGTSQPKLIEAVSLMEANISEPLTMSELSHHIELSKRQLERLFKRYLQCVPSRYYLELRLENARRLLLQTAVPIATIATECGFVSLPHFSKCYRNIFSVPPRDERRRAAGLLQNNTVTKATRQASH